LLAELRLRAQVIGTQYNLARRDYEARARRYGFDPAAVVGEHPGEVIRARREREANQRPDINDIRFGGDPQGPEAGFNDQQRAAYDAFNAANPNATADQLRAFGQSIG